MPRIACIVAGAAAAAIGVSAAGNACAAPRQEHRHSPATVHPRQAAAPASRAPVRSAVVYPHAGYAPAYPSPHYSASRQPLTFSRAATPPVYFVPAVSPNAPPFSFSDSVEQPGWNWQRVSLQQIDAEVRAKRAARDSGIAPSYRKYCPDTRAYYPDVEQCASEWLTVVARAPARAGAQSDFASR